MKRAAVTGAVFCASLILISGCGNSPTTTTTGDTRAPAIGAPITMPQPEPQKPTPAPVQKPSSPLSPAPAKTIPKVFSIAIKNFSFSPGIIYVERGTIVTWINYDTAEHTVTGDAGGPASATLASGKKYSYVFNEIGTFPYHCKFHSNMKGTIVVTPAK